MPSAKPIRALRDTRVGRTLHFSSRLQAQLEADAVRCGRSFEAQVLAILRRHYGEDVDIAPTSMSILALAAGSMEGVPERDRAALTRKLGDDA
jgi:hypothetical protein